MTAPASEAALAAYLKQAGWVGCSRGGMAVHVLAAPGCLSEGEALRFVEEKDVVKGDFVLVSGSVVGNVDLRPAVQAHVVRRGIDRQAVMTLLLHQGCLASDTSAPYLDDCLVVADPCSHQLLKLEHGNRAVHTANMGTHVFGERDVVVVRLAASALGLPGTSAHVGQCWSLRHLHLCPLTKISICDPSPCCRQVRSGLRLSHVYICAPEALVLLSDNFDYQSIAGDLVPGVLSEQELGSTLYVHELARVRSGTLPSVGFCSCIRK